MKGIILAGGAGTRLHPVTLAVSKQLLPVYNKPMIYYPLSVLMLADIRDILIISTSEDQPLFQRLLGDGSELGLDLSYAVQPEPGGLPEAFIIGADFAGDDSIALILGDNIFYGPHMAEFLQESRRDLDGCVLFGYPVSDPERYGVGEVDEEGLLVSIEEKPAKPRTNRAITGLYFFDNRALDIAKNLTPSARGELEITDVIRPYQKEGKAKVIDLGHGFAWLDTGTHDSLLDASQYVQVLERRQGVRIACIEEIALRRGLVDAEVCHRRGASMAKSGYGEYVMKIARQAQSAAPDRMAGAGATRKAGLG
ncbi:glucose-1-phosphate thymidylyltransferase RfbA [Streptomyces albus]|uniref:glucose-1-phosphate thymidylyltransferase RfbA n=1 Tax=Streptomyces TaxID=1883 RepID=UPI0004C1812F|nr:MULTISPECIES: glucose-1-phosphate thymidylyltransferase RfbA [unclassified Streptomyces]